MAYINSSKLLLFFLILFLLPFSFSFAQELHQDIIENIRAEVVEVINEEYRVIPRTDIEALHQEILVEIREGKREGERVVIENDFYELKVGDKFFLTRIERMDGSETFAVGEPDRRGILILLSVLFLIAVLSFGFWKGIRAVVSLLISFWIIIFLLLPKLLDGASPVPTIIIFSALILAFAMYITHGWNRVTHAALLGTTTTIVGISFLAYLGVELGRLTGFASHEAIYLNLQTGGMLNISGLLLGAIIIGVLGVLDDISITQSATVRELHKAAPHLGRIEIFRRTLSIGKEHVVSLVNTLALAYAGAALPLLLLFSADDGGFLSIINMEIFATEIIRTLVGSIGLIIAVPITTVFAVFLLIGEGAEKAEKEGKIPIHTHTHSH